MMSVSWNASLLIKALFFAMAAIIISQPMYFPWLGMHEQMRLADDYVDYSDVAFSKGSFTNRVQVKTAAGSQWLTVPLLGSHLGATIEEMRTDERQNWRRKHRATLAQAYARAPFKTDMLCLVDQVFDSCPGDNLAALTLKSMQVVHRYFGFEKPLRWHSSKALGIGGVSSKRVFDIVRHLGGNRYITGHGARHYLDHRLFEESGISVDYLDYHKTPYPQLHGPFTPYVTALDLVANAGPEGARHINSPARPWREFLP